MKTAPMIIAIMALVLGGCATTGLSGAFDKDGLPKQQYYVGGGFSLNYRAMIPGTVYVVEENTGTLLITESLGTNQVYDADIDPTNEDVHLRLKSTGIDPTNMKLSLYFVPAKETQGSQED